MKKRYLIFMLFIIMILMPSVYAGYNGASGQLSIPQSASPYCDPSWSGYCLWNAATTKGLQITLYYFGENGNRTQIGNQVHVINNRDVFYRALEVAGYDKQQIDDWLTNVVIAEGLYIQDGTWYFETEKIEKYLLDEKIFGTYLKEYIGVNLSDLTLLSEEPGFDSVGYRLVVEPMYSALLKGDFYLKTVKELAAHGITNPDRYRSMSASLYLEDDDVGITKGNSNGTSNRADIADPKKGWGYNIIDISVKLPQECEWTTETSCCDEKNNLTGTELENFQLAHPACFPSTGTTKPSATCDFKLDTSILNTCTINPSRGYIKDIDNWGCIYESATANNASVKSYFLKHGSATSDCAVYCRDELEYEYPKKGMRALAGNRFTIGNNLNSYNFEVVSGRYQVIPASLGPVKVTIKRECSITGTADEACNDALQNQLNDLGNSSPTITFTYDSNFYGKVTETLDAEFIPDEELDETVPDTDPEIKRKTVAYKYKLPSNTYRFVSKNIGISYKIASGAGLYPVIDIGPHLPLHFTQTNNEIDFELNITEFNLPNFDNLIIDGDEMPEQYSSSIESYIKTLIDSGYANPRLIGSVYYLDNDFINLLAVKDYSVDNFFGMNCADTDKYTCYRNANGIFCYDEGTISNSTSTYVLFNACINNAMIEGDTISYEEDLKYTCSFDVDKVPNQPTDPHNSQISIGINAIFRTISLNNPFPSIDGDGRKTGTNWCYDRDCSNTNTVVDSVILNNRGVDSNDIYKELDPLYKIVLTPNLIKEIRRYNNTTDYDDFNLECTDEGNNCKSKFLRKKINNKYDFRDYFSGCGIVGRNHGLDCALNEAW